MGRWHRRVRGLTRMGAVVDGVTEPTVRELGVDWAARTAHQAVSGRPEEIAGLGRSVGIHLLCSSQRTDAAAVPE